MISVVQVTLEERWTIYPGLMSYRADMVLKGQGVLQEILSTMLEEIQEETRQRMEHHKSQVTALLNPSHSVKWLSGFNEGLKT